CSLYFSFFQAEDGIRDLHVTGVQTCALPIYIAIIGSGPAGYYTAEAAQKALGDQGRIDIFDSLPVPYGLIRSGVAPDHQSIKGRSEERRGGKEGGREGRQGCEGERSGG